MECVYHENCMKNFPPIHNKQHFLLLVGLFGSLSLTVWVILMILFGPDDPDDPVGPDGLVGPDSPDGADGLDGLVGPDGPDDPDGPAPKAGLGKLFD